MIKEVNNKKNSNKHVTRSQCNLNVHSRGKGKIKDTPLVSVKRIQLDTSF